MPVLAVGHRLNNTSGIQVVWKKLSLEICLLKASFYGHHAKMKEKQKAG
jgi:hypothetical protein